MKLTEQQIIRIFRSEGRALLETLVRERRAHLASRPSGPAQAFFRITTGPFFHRARDLYSGAAAIVLVTKGRQPRSWPALSSYVTPRVRALREGMTSA